MDPHQVEVSESLLRIKRDAWVMELFRISQPDWVMLHFESTDDPLLPSIRVLLHKTEFRDLLSELDRCLEAVRMRGLVRLGADGTFGNFRGTLSHGRSFGTLLNHENTGILIIGYDLRFGQHGVDLNVWPIHRRGIPNFLWPPEQASALLGRLREIRNRLFPDM